MFSRQSKRIVPPSPFEIKKNSRISNDGGDSRMMTHAHRFDARGKKYCVYTERVSRLSE